MVVQLGDCCPLLHTSVDHIPVDGLVHHVLSTESFKLSIDSQEEIITKDNNFIIIPSTQQTSFTPFDYDQLENSHWKQPQENLNSDSIFSVSTLAENIQQDINCCHASWCIEDFSSYNDIEILEAEVGKDNTENDRKTLCELDYSQADQAKMNDKKISFNNARESCQSWASISTTSSEDYDHDSLSEDIWAHSGGWKVKTTSNTRKRAQPPTTDSDGRRLQKIKQGVLSSDMKSINTRFSRSSETATDLPFYFVSEFLSNQGSLTVTDQQHKGSGIDSANRDLLNDSCHWDNLDQTNIFCNTTDIPLVAESQQQLVQPSAIIIVKEKEASPRTTMGCGTLDVFSMPSSLCLIGDQSPLWATSPDIGAGNNGLGQDLAAFEVEHLKELRETSIESELEIPQCSGTERHAETLLIQSHEGQYHTRNHIISVEPKCATHHSITQLEGSEAASSDYFSQSTFNCNDFDTWHASEAQPYYTTTELNQNEKLQLPLPESHDPHCTTQNSEQNAGEYYDMSFVNQLYNFPDSTTLTPNTIMSCDASNESISTSSNSLCFPSSDCPYWSSVPLQASYYDLPQIQKTSADEISEESRTSKTQPKPQLLKRLCKPRSLIKPSRIKCGLLHQLMPFILKQFESPIVSRKGLCRGLTGMLYADSPQPSPNFLLNTLLPVYRSADSLGFLWEAYPDYTLTSLKSWISHQHGGAQLLHQFRILYNAPQAKIG